MSNGSHRPSRTALAVARAFSLLAHHPDWRSVAPQGAVEATRKIVSSLTSWQRTDQRLLGFAPYRAFARLIDRHGPLKGGILHLALRKRWIEEQVRSAIADGFTQLVVLGAGYCPLAWRIAREFPSVLCFEVDNKATQREKYKALVSLAREVGSKELPENLHLFVLDLAQGAIDRALTANKRADRGRPTLFVAEGVLMYLDESDALQVLKSVRNLATPRSRIIFSYLGADDRGAPHAGSWDRAMKTMVRLAGEPFRFAIAPEKLGEALAAHGLALREQIDEEALIAKYLPVEHRPAALLDWEFLACAERE